MKLLGWMHRKLMQDSTEPMKSYTIGTHPTRFPIQTDQKYYYIDPPPKTSSHPNTKHGGSFQTSRVEEESFDDPFDFLSIGTFGIELLNNTTDPPTPTLPMSGETLTDQQPMEITENDLNLMNSELEKFLEAEEAETGNRVDVQMVACPLRNYLFAASVGLPEANKTRTSLEELFKRNNVAVVDDGDDDDDDPPFLKNCEEAAKQEDGKGNVAHFMKKVAKRFHPTSDPMRKKLSEGLDKMFHKKVYPEEATEKRFFKVSKRNKKKKKNISNHPIGDNKSDQPAAGRKSRTNTMKLFWTGICRANGSSSSPVNDTGHWIKTDSDYVVLEL